MRVFEYRDHRFADCAAYVRSGLATATENGHPCGWRAFIELRDPERAIS